MQAFIYNFSKKDKSTKQPTGGTEIDIKLKQPTSILRPSLLIEGYKNFNYMYIPAWNRYYKVDNINYLSNDIIEVPASVDPFASFKSDILASSQMVARSSALAEPYLIDSRYHTKLDINRSVLSGQSISLEAAGEYVPNPGAYVIGISAHSGFGEAVTYYALDIFNLESLLDALFSTSNWLNIDFGESGLNSDIIKYFADPLKYVVSFKYFPGLSVTDIQSGSATQSIKFGFWDSGISAPKAGTVKNISICQNTFNVGEHPSASANYKYLNANPFTKFYLSFPPFGECELDPMKFRESNYSITTKARVDFSTGDAILRVFPTGHENKAVAEMHGEWGIDLPLSMLKQDLVGARHGIINSALNGAFAIGQSAMTGNIADMITAGVNTFHGIENSYNQSAPQVTVEGGKGTFVNHTYTPRLIIERSYLSGTDAEHLGYPLMKKIQLNSITGYTECVNAALDINCLNEEMNEIISGLNSGFYIE